MFEHPKIQQALKTADKYKYVNGGVNACFTVWNDSGLIRQADNEGCHVHFNAESATLVVSKFISHDDMKIEYEAFKKWIFGPDSPWKMITHQDDVFLYDDKAVVIGPDTLSCIHPDFIKNFVILLRMMAEKYYLIRSWYLFVDKYEMDPRDAFVLCVYVKIDDEGRHLWSYGANNGGHWPLNENTDFSRYWEGQVDKTRGSKINGFFESGQKTPLFKFPEGVIRREKMKTRFGEGMFELIDIDLLVKLYLEWKDK